MALSDLLPASFRGVPFAVERSGGSFGRRLAIHQYPGRDTPFTEDMGRKAQLTRLSGFILEGDKVYGGLDIELQRNALMAAAQADGPGILVHPTLGIMNVFCESLSISEGLEAGVASDIEWNFVEAGNQSALAAAISTVLQTLSNVAAAATAVTEDISTALNLAQGASNSAEVEASVVSAAWSGQVQTASLDATAIMKLASQLPGPYGRYYAGANSGFTTGSLYAAATTVTELEAAAAVARANVSSAAAALAATFQGSSTATTLSVATAIGTLVSALLAACADPADAVRLLLSLQQFSTGGSSAVAGVIGDAYRRQIVLALATASAAYQPSSQNDAETTMWEILGAIDAEIEIAGNEGEDGTFNALRSLYQAVAADFTARGAALAPIKTFSLGESVPDVVAAQIIYRDPTRAPQLTTQVNEVNPLFMPPTFQALAV